MIVQTGRRNFCIQARQSVHQAIPEYGRTGNSCGPVKSNIWLGNPLKEEESWLAMILLHTLGWFPSWCTVVWGEGALGVRPPSSFWSCSPSPCNGSIWFPDCQGWDSGGCKPLGDRVSTQLHYPWCWHRTQEGGEGQPSKQSFVSITWWWVVKIYLASRVHGGLLKLGISSEVCSNPFS